MTPADFHGEMSRFRDHAIAQRDALDELIEAIGIAMPLFTGSAAPAIAAPKTAPPKPAPPRPPSPAPQATSGAGLEAKVVKALSSGPRAPGAIAQTTGIPSWKVKSTLKTLVTSNQVRKTGTGPRNTQYQLA